MLGAPAAISMIANGKIAVVIQSREGALIAPRDSHQQ